jgi:hypothetical protein
MDTFNEEINDEKGEKFDNLPIIVECDSIGKVNSVGSFLFIIAHILYLPSICVVVFTLFLALVEDHYFAWSAFIVCLSLFIIQILYLQWMQMYATFTRYEINSERVKVTCGDKEKVMWFEPLSAYESINWYETPAGEKGQVHWRVILNHGSNAERSVQLLTCESEQGQSEQTPESEATHPDKETALMAWRNAMLLLELAGKQETVVDLQSVKASAALGVFDQIRATGS